MRTTAWAVAGFVAAAAFSMAAPAQVTEATHCGGQRAAHAPRTADRAPPSGRTSHHGYVVAVRMGWAAG